MSLALILNLPLLFFHFYGFFLFHSLLLASTSSLLPCSNIALLLFYLLWAHLLVAMVLGATLYIMV
jgi:hypothetical protein